MSFMYKRTVDREFLAHGQVLLVLQRHAPQHLQLRIFKILMLLQAPLILMQIAGQEQTILVIIIG